MSICLNLNVIFELNREQVQIGGELSFVLCLFELHLDKSNILRICKRMAEKFIHKNID